MSNCKGRRCVQLWGQKMCPTVRAGDVTNCGGRTRVQRRAGFALGSSILSSNPGGSRFSRLLTRPDRHQGPNSLLYNKHRGFFSEAKRPERGVDRSPSSSVEYMYTSTPPLCHSRHVNGRSLPLQFKYLRSAGDL